MQHIEQSQLKAIFVRGQEDFIRQGSISDGRVHLQSWVGNSKAQEDALYFSHDMQNGIVFLAVADGLGSYNGGAEAARICVEALHDTIISLGHKFEHTKLSRYIRLKMRKNPTIMYDEKLPGGACMTYARINLNKRTVKFYSIGDTQGLIINNTGTLRFQTQQDLKPLSKGVTRALSPIMSGVNFSETDIVNIYSGDRIFCFSDGIDKTRFLNFKYDSCSEIINEYFNEMKQQVINSKSGKVFVDNSSVISFKFK